MPIFDPIRLGASIDDDYEIERSLRFGGGDDTRLRYGQNTSDRRTFTFSFWTKRGHIGTNLTNAQHTICSAAMAAGGQFALLFMADDTFQVREFSVDANAETINLRTNQAFRDTTNWYHFVVAIDSTQSTASDRAKIYVNGSQITDFASASYPSQNRQFNVSNATSNQRFHIGVENFDGTSNEYRGYFADFNFLDGITKQPTDFGKTNPATNQWVPKKYTGGNYGTNGFFLEFKDNSNNTAATIGKDTSGQGNNLTPNAISVTTKYLNDSVIDTPTNNFPVMNVLDSGSFRSSSIFEGGLKVTNGNHQLAKANVYFGPGGIQSGKWYWEIRVQGGSFSMYAGITSEFFQDGGEIANQTNKNFLGSHTSKTFSAGSGTGRTNQGTGVYAQFLLDVDNQEMIAKYDGTTVFTDTSIPDASTTSYVPFVFSTNDGGSGGLWASMFYNFGQQEFNYTQPSGYKKICTANLSDSAVKRSTDAFEALTYSGQSSGNTTVTGLNYQPDFIWIKSRAGSSAPNSQLNYLIDSVRGATSSDTKKLYSNSTAAENGGQSASDNSLNFLSNGFELTSNNDGTNDTNTYVAWTWNAGGSTVTNTDGSISTQVRANPTAGIAIATYTGNNASATIGHGLGVPPKFVIIKRRDDTGDWIIGSDSITSNAFQNNKFLKFTTAQEFSNSLVFGSQPTSTTMQITTAGSATNLNGSGMTYVAYMFAEIPGFSRIHRYQGTGTTDGAYVHCGFTPAFVLTKCHSGINENWTITDNKRSPSNPRDKFLRPDETTADTSGAAKMDFLANGFKLKSTDTKTNKSGSGYTFLAFAQNPFKTSNAQ